MSSDNGGKSFFQTRRNHDKAEVSVSARTSGRTVEQLAPKVLKQQVAQLLDALLKLYENASVAITLNDTRRLAHDDVNCGPFWLRVRCAQSAYVPPGWKNQVTDDMQVRRVLTKISAFWDPRNSSQTRAARAMSALWATNRISSTSACKDSVSALDGRSTSWLLPPPSCLEWTIRHLMA